MKKIILLICSICLIGCHDNSYEPSYSLPETIVVDLEEVVDQEAENVSEDIDEDLSNIDQDEVVEEHDEIEVIEMTEKEVLWLQESLKIAGFYTARDGAFGPNTQKQLEAYKLSQKFMSEGYTSDVKNALENLRINKLAQNFDTNLVVLTKDSYIPSSYVPDHLREVNVDKNKYMELPNEVAEQVEKMFEAAEKDGYHIVLASAYRSYDYQEGIFSRRVASHGFDEAQTVVAIPGQSEHQTGLAIDITTEAMSYGLDQSFEKEAEFQWMMDHCYEYGFILSYRKDKVDLTGYIYEPWHYRYLGDQDLAKQIMDAGITLQEYFE